MHTSRLFRLVRLSPLRLYIGLSLLLVGLARSDAIPFLELRSYAEPAWLYGVLQVAAGLGLLLTLPRRTHWTGRAAGILAVGVASMLAWALAHLLSTGSVFYAVGAVMLLIFEVGTDGQ